MFNRIDLITVGGGMVSTILFWSKVLADNRKIAGVFLRPGCENAESARMNIRISHHKCHCGRDFSCIVEISGSFNCAVPLAVTGMELFAGILSRECYLTNQLGLL